MTDPPDDPATRDHWRQALNAWLARRERTRKLREELAAVRAYGKAARHARRHRQETTK